MRLQSGRIFTPQEVMEIRDLYRAGAKRAEIVARYGGSIDGIGRLIAGITYANVPGALSISERRAMRRGRRPRQVVNGGRWVMA